MTSRKYNAALLDMPSLDTDDKKHQLHHSPVYEGMPDVILGSSSQQHSPAQIVPLRHHSNENSFFGAEAVTAKEIHEYFGEVAGKMAPAPTMLSFEPAEFHLSDKENIFACDVNMSDEELMPPVKLSRVCPKPEDNDSDEVFELSESVCSSGSSEFDIVPRPRKVRRIVPKPSYSSPIAPKDIKMAEKCPRWEGDLYTPRWQRGVGDSKEGLCPLCEEEVWLRIKQSSYWYHMNYHHGISATTGKPYDPPADFEVERLARTGVDEAVIRLSGLCSKCHEWVTISTKHLDEDERQLACPLEDLIDIPSVNLMTWYRHSQRCARS